MSLNKRPKLQLQTSSLLVSRSKPSLGLAIADITAPTPTTQNNTFSNQFDLTSRPSPGDLVMSPTLQQQVHRPSLKPCIPHHVRPSERPYPYALNLPIGVRSILKNSPVPWDLRQGSFTGASASPRSATGRRVFFPPPKKVSFRPQLEEEIPTRTYLQRHSEIESDDDSDLASASSSDGAESETPSLQQEELDEARPVAQRGRLRRRRSQVESTTTTEIEASSSPRRTRRKRRRWEWTLGSLPKSSLERNDNTEIVEETGLPPSPISEDLDAGNSSLEEAQNVDASAGLVSPPSLIALDINRENSCTPTGMRTDGDEHSVVRVEVTSQ